MVTDLLKMAKQGNADAIASLMNRQLQPKGITAKVTFRDSCVYVLLESATIPDQKAVAPFVVQGMTKLAIELADSLQVYGKQTGEKRPSWSQAYSLSKAENFLADNLANNTQNIKTEDTSAEQTNSIEELAPTSGLDAIASHLNRIIGNEKMNIKVISEDKLLKVIAETDQFLDAAVFAENIYKELKNLDLSKFETVGIYKQKLKSGQCFQLKSFLLTNSELETLEQKNSKVAMTHTQGVISKSSKTNQFKPQAPKSNKPQIKIGRVLGVVVILIIAGFIIIGLVRRMLILVFLSPALGSFSVILGIFFIWRSYSFLMPLFQKLLSLLSEE
ncbi:hypothetical protein I8752_23415 [Nostocaceae cyanobacterium CENA369]|uniref:Uncharacterized protein n=1 Tax=Dendronalium phyllosphericum CENA369 TaxID=1725256 RepID=A0A8J7I4P6_9NOST|nr:hypothetical protein [Dendronalium phyllosphericum]MBH8575894.1 hypothetical protein [Dendronalium phyllosphericum CENA369]